MLPFAASKAPQSSDQPARKHNMADNPQHTDLGPSANPSPKKDHGESYNEAMNGPNNPTKNERPNVPYNVTDGYTKTYKG